MKKQFFMICTHKAQIIKFQKKSWTIFGNFWSFLVIFEKIGCFLTNYIPRSLKRANPVISTIINMASMHISKKYRICTHQAHYFLRTTKLFKEFHFASKSQFLKNWLVEFHSNNFIRWFITF